MDSISCSLWKVTEGYLEKVTIVFVILLPEFIVRQGIVNGLLIVILAAISVLVVHLLLNWIYVAVVMVPLTMSALFFTVGCLTWLFSPVAFFAIEGILNFITIFFGGGFDLSLLNEFFTRLGQFFMIISGALWWIVNKMFMII
ncbi:MAG: hypothetical protein ACOX6X_02210 [Dethiobacteria bacterium]|jgi:hypothetical protein